MLLFVYTSITRPFAFVKSHFDQYFNYIQSSSDPMTICQLHNKHKNFDGKKFMIIIQSSCSRKTSSRKTFRHTSLTTVRSGLVRCQSNDDITTKPECIIKIKVTSRSAGFSIDRYALHVCGYTRWYFTSYGPGREVVDRDSGADVKEGIVDGVSRYER